MLSLETRDQDFLKKSFLNLSYVEVQVELFPFLEFCYIVVAQAVAVTIIALIILFAFDLLKILDLLVNNKFTIMSKTVTLGRHTLKLIWSFQGVHV